jgi:SPP1 family predicted phage head-tail adaptor
MIGPLRERFTIRTPSVATDAQGGQVVTWANGVGIWASATPHTAREWAQAGALHNAVSHRLLTRYHPDLAVTTRLYWEPNGPALEVVEVRDVDNRSAWLEVVAIEVDA